MSLFADPLLFLRLREQVVPDLRTWPWPNVWVAGGDEGQVAYALAVLLREEGVLSRTMIYATAPSRAEVAAAQRGVYSGCDGERLEAAYRAAGGRASVSEYGLRRGDEIHVRPTLRERMTFLQHDPLVDGSFNEFQMIVSGTSFERWPADAAARVLGLYHASLCRFGTLVLLRPGGMAMHPRRSSYAPLGDGAHLSRRMR